MTLIKFWYVLVLISFVSGAEIKHHTGISILATSVNVKTVLFTEEDLARTCLDIESVQLLVARRVMQDLIPKRITRDFGALLEFVNKAEIILKMRSRDEKEYRYLKQAMYDAIGGYLYAITIPVLNEAYYAGKVEYNIAHELHSVLRRMMTFLHTNGGLWADPCDMDRVPTRVQPLTLNLCLQDQSCDNFVIPSDLQPHIEQGEGTSDGNKTFCNSENLKIQLPFLDDDLYPNAIVVPFKQHALFSLLTQCSVNIVPKYYILAMRCLSHPQFSNEDIIVFNQRLHRWIMSIVLPHLQDTDRFLAGFGGVMRVVETMIQRGLTSTAQHKPNIHKINASCSIPINLDEKWYSSYVSKVKEPRNAFFLGLGAISFLTLVILVHLVRKAYCRNEQCDCEMCLQEVVSEKCGSQEASNESAVETDDQKKSRNEDEDNYNSYSAYCHVKNPRKIQPFWRR